MATSNKTDKLTKINGVLDADIVERNERFLGDPRSVVLEDFEDETRTTIGELAAETLEMLGPPPKG